MKTLIKNIKQLVQVRDQNITKLKGKQMSYLPTLSNAWLLINEDKIENFVFALPPKTEQQQIYDFLQKETTNFDDIISKSQSQINFLQEKRQALITSAVTGKIDVRNGVAA